MRTDLPSPTIGAPALPAPACDCTQCAFWTGPDGPGRPPGPATIEPLCSGCNASCSYCGCARNEAHATTTGGPTGACGQCPIRCGSRVDIAAWMADVGGRLGFDDLTLTGPKLLSGLPRFVPQTDGTATRALDAGLDWPAYAVGLRRVFSPTSHAIVPRFADRTAREALDLPDGRLAVLAGYGLDPLVEAFWSRRHRDGLLDAIAAQEWDLVLAPNYSIYGNWPRVEHLLNMRRSLLVASELADRGVPVLPNVYWYRLEDLTRWAAWIHQQHPPGIAINLQTVRQPADWDTWALPGLTWLAVNLPAELPVVLTGLSRTDRIRHMAALFGPRLFVISQNPYQYALHGAVMTTRGRRDVHAHKADAFAATVRTMADLLTTPTMPTDGREDT